MSSLEARIDELRLAASSLVNSAETVRNAKNVAHGIVDQLVVRGFQSPAADKFYAEYRRERSIMDTWPDELESFSHRLEEAADAIEEAVRQSGDGPDTPGGGGDVFIPPGQGGTPPGQGGTPPGQGGTPPGQSGDSPGNSGNAGNSGTGGTSSGTGGSSSGGGVGGGSSGRGRTSSGGAGSSGGGSSSSEPEVVLEAPPLDAYANQHNQAMMQELTRQQAALETEQSNLSTLEGRRAEIQGELDRLTQVLGTTAGVTPNARVRGLREQLAAIDAEIAASQQNIENATNNIASLQDRLERVSPGAGADLELIASLEGSRTSDAILNATRQADNSVNCVNFVCSRMPIPPGIPNNAYLWPENALRHPEYGIKMGDVPLPGSVMVMQPEHSFADDRFGHVLYVERVEPDGSVWVTDNFNHTPVLLSSLTDEVSGPNITYMYFPWETQA